MERHQLKVAIYLLLIKDNNILLTRRFKTGWQDGNYGLPAGHLEANETIVQAVIRETQEEIGINVNPENIRCVHTMHRLNRYIDLFFVSTNWQGEPQNKELNKCDDVRWFPLDLLPENIIPSIKHVIQQYQNHISFSEFLLEEK